MKSKELQAIHDEIWTQIFEQQKRTLEKNASAVESHRAKDIADRPNFMSKSKVGPELHDKPKNE
jgi:hypothetical protein